MSQLRVEQLVLDAASLGPVCPLFPVSTGAANAFDPAAADPAIPAEHRRNLGYGAVDGHLPYMVQNRYDRIRRPRPFRVAVLETRWLKATFLLEFGGRLWSLFDKQDGRELLYANPVFQPANFAIRNAWFSGGVEWNFGWPGHTVFTCAPLFAARLATDCGCPVLRLYEWERVRQMPFQIDAWLAADSPRLYVRVTLVNPHDREVPVYWWSNIAVPEQSGSRVLAPAAVAYNFGYRGGLSRVAFPTRDRGDGSYPTRQPRANDFFFLLENQARPWIAWFDRDGEGVYQASTARLAGRKMFVHGTGPGGRRWQTFLTEPGHPYLEIQAGLARTQGECLPLPAHARWSWLEAYGPARVEASVVHDRHWHAAWSGVERWLETELPGRLLDEELERAEPLARRPPAELLQRGSGWGAMERRRCSASGRPDPGLPSIPFGDDSLGPEQRPWLDLLETGALPDADPALAPVSWMVQQEWRQRLETALGAGGDVPDAGRTTPSEAIGQAGGGHAGSWLSWLHLGVMHLAEREHDRAAEAWRTSLARRPSAWAHRNLGALARAARRPEEAVEHYLAAVALRPHDEDLLVECGGALLDAGHSRRWLDLLETLERPLRARPRLVLLEGRAALNEGQVERVQRILDGDLEIPDVREGEVELTELWFACHEQRLARAEGRPVDDEIRRRVRRDCPPPPRLDFRMQVSG